jgi:hypothetical protein
VFAAHHRPVKVLGAVAFCLVLAGCGAGGPGTSAGSTATASPGPFAGPTATASPEPSLGALCAHEFEACTLPAGTYSSVPFEPLFTFTIGDGWTNDRAWPHGGGISEAAGGIFWAVDVDEGLRDGTPEAFDSSPDGFINHLRAITGLVIKEGESFDVGGRTGRVVDVATRQTDARAIYVVVEDNYNLGPGEKARFILFEGDTLLLFVVEAFREQDFEAVWGRAETVLGTIRWL